MKTKTLTEAAAEMFEKSKSSAPKDAPKKLEGEVEDLGGDTPEHVAEKNPDAAKGVGKATPPGKTPPVGSDPMKKLKEGKKEEEEKDGDDDESSDADSPDWLTGKGDKKAKGKDEDEDDEDDEDDKKKKMEEALRVELRHQMQEDLGALFAGDDLPEDFKKKAYAIFEAAVIARSNKLLEAMEEKYADALEEAVEEIKEELTENTDKYLSHVVEEWVTENQIAIESSLKSELTEEFITGLRNLFNEHNISVPEDKVDIVEEMAKEIAEKDEKLNAEMNKTIELTEQVTALQRKSIVADVCDGLTDVQKTKISPLAEGIEFTTEDEFRQQVLLMVENYFPSTPVAKGSGGVSTLEEGLNLEEDNKTPKSKDPTVNAIVNALNRTTQK